MNKVSIITLPYPSTALLREPILSLESSALLLSMDFDDEGQKRNVTLQFNKQRAFRKRGEIYCTEWHIKGTYDTICEVIGSDWVNELFTDAMPDKRDKWVMRHFIVYIDSFGCLEVICEEVEIRQSNNVI